MKKALLFIGVISSLTFSALSVHAQKKVSMSEGSMTWTTKSAQARSLTTLGLSHMMSVEREQAYHHLKAAVETDPNFTVALALLSHLTRGETRKAFAKRAQESAMNKTEGEKLFASLTTENTTPEARREIWSRLHVMYPNDRAIEHFYTITRATPEERFAAMNAYVQKYPEEPGMYNMLGYYYMNDKKDNEAAKANFEKFIQLFPDGANPYDSMGEFYLQTGDTANAEKYYKMALDRYPFMVSAIQGLDKIAEGKKKTEKSQ